MQDVNPFNGPCVQLKYPQHSLICKKTLSSVAFRNYSKVQNTSKISFFNCNLIQYDIEAYT